MKVIKTFSLSLLGASSFMAMMAMTAAPASAQATRTWVSGVGDDVNPCSRTAPCKTFAGAISKTATDGEINCLDPGGFGGLTITKSISIVCQYTEGGVLSAGAGVNGFVVNATSSSRIYLRGLDFHGAGSAQNGLRVLVAGSVTMEDSVIRSYNASLGNGISFQPSGTTNLTLNNVTLDNNGLGAGGAGILVQPTGTGSGRVVMNNVRVTNNPNNGLIVNTTGNTGTGITVVIEDSTFSGNAQGISLVGPAATATAVVHVDGSTIANNTVVGITTNGPTATVRVNDTTITGNAMGVNPLGGSQIGTFGNNRLIGNPTVGAPNNGAFNGTPLQAL